jgi:hypothetical protein
MSLTKKRESRKEKKSNKKRRKRMSSSKLHRMSKSLILQELQIPNKMLLNKA